MKDIKIYRTGTLEIVSSGYSDRWCMADVWLVIESDGICFRIDTDSDREGAILQLMGCEYTTENIQIAARLIAKSDLELRGSYTKGNMSASIKLDAAKIRAGIDIVTGCRNLNELGIKHAKELSKNWTEHELNFIECGLTVINKRHAERGLTVVDFDMELLGA